jgi:WG containing repeat
MVRLLACLVAVSIVFGCEWDYSIWIPRSSTADTLYRFIKNGKAGYIDANGQVVVPPKLTLYSNSGSEFHNGLLEVAASDGEYVDRTGKLVIDKGLYRGWGFSEGLAVAMRKGERLWGYINTSGEFAISPRFESSLSDYVWSFADGLARIKVKDKFGFIDHSGAFVIQPQLLNAIDFHDGMARVVTEGPCVYLPDGPCADPEFVGGRRTGPAASCKFTYIDKSGTMLTKERFDFARDFSEGLAPVRIGELWGYIDKMGSIVITPRFEDAESFHSGLSRIRMNGLYGYADKSGNIVVKPRQKHAESFSDGLAVVGDDLGYWYIDQHGNQTFQGKFEVASPFFKGLANVKLSDGFAYITKSGRSVFSY